jgi:hypothetical protein
MLNQDFIQYLIQKLKNGNRASIHLNALPSNFLTRLDIGRLNVLEDDDGKSVFFSNSGKPLLGSSLLDKLLNQASFSFGIDFYEQSFQQLSDEQKDQLKFLSKRLDSIYYQSLDNLSEYGLKTLGFGFPLLIKHDSNDPKKIIKAPLLIWQLEIEKSKNQANSWILKKEEDFVISVNEILISHLFNDENVIIDAIPAEFLEDRIIQKEELISLCTNILSQINRKPYNCGELNLENCPSAKKIETSVNKQAYIEWSGILGIYKNQKQSIIKELETIVENIHEFDIEDHEKLEFESKISGVDTDPSQERIINNFAENDIKVIQGPPGTGKSQTLSAIITNALENKKKCMVVCEKKTAIDVIFRNLDKLGIGSLCAVIYDMSHDRERIIQLARSKIEIENTEKFPEHLYRRNVDNYERLKQQINEKLSKYRKPCFGDFNHKELTGLFIENQMIAGYELIGNHINSADFKFNFDEYEDLLLQINKVIIELEKASAENSGLNIIKDDIFLSKPTDVVKHEMFLQLEELGRLLGKVKAEAEKYQEMTGNSYNKKSFFRNLETGTFGIFNSKLSHIHQQKKEIWKAYINLGSEFNNIDFLKENLCDFDVFRHYSEMNTYIGNLKTSVEKCLGDYKDFWIFQEWRRFFYSQTQYIQDFIKIIEKLPPEQRLPAFKSWYLNECLRSIFYKENLQDVFDDLKEFILLKESFKDQQIKKISNFWSIKQKSEIDRFSESGENIKRLYNYRKNKEFGRKNSLRNIINADFDLFSSFFPVILTNPVVCSSVLPMKLGLFDIVIFDEASQLRIEDTYSAYLRGKYKVISGDRHQMPPSSYFNTGQAISLSNEIDEESEESAYLAESESLLEFAEENTIRQTYLEFHYRSCHPYLIDFSNAAFYGNRLIPMPAKKTYKPFRFIEAGGIYADGENQIEAGSVVDVLANEIEEFEDGTMPSVGVATTNIYQRNLIWDKIGERCISDAKFSKKFARLYANHFFVKNLENIQGDEWDIVIISTTFGKDDQGNFIQNFGPINQANGYRLLNVIVTRAKQKVFICSSIPSAFFYDYKSLIEKSGNSGRGVFYAYLAYANAIENENDTERKDILSFLSANCKETNVKSANIGTNGPFENSLKKYLSGFINPDRIKTPFQFGGFYIDMVVISNNGTNKNLAYECNGGGNFNDDEAYIHLSFRKKILENYGFQYLPVLSLMLWKDPVFEFKKLIDSILELMPENE